MQMDKNPPKNLTNFAIMTIMIIYYLDNKNFQMSIESQNHKKQAEKIEEPILNHMRTEVQKIIDNHLKWEKNFSVMDYGYQELNLLINLLTWRKTREDLEDELEQNERRMQIIYEEIVCEYDFMKSLENLIKETKMELASLDKDLLLESQLSNVEFI